MSQTDSKRLGAAVLKIAIPSKGRLNERAVRLLHRAGMSFRRRERRLYCSVKNLPVAVIFANAGDVPTLVAEGVVDLGITGQDLVRERRGRGDAEGETLEELLPLGFGRCRMCLAVREASGVARVQDLAGRKIGTSFPHTSREYLERSGVDAHVIALKGSLEVMVALGLVDAIVDLVETGDSLRDNHLVPIDEIARSEAVLLGRAATGDREPHPMRDRLVRRVQGVIIADQYAVCEYNLPTARLDEARQITPGFSSPTVQQTNDPALVAVKVMVRQDELADAMERLEAIGATAIFATEITNCRL